MQMPHHMTVYVSALVRFLDTRRRGQRKRWDAIDFENYIETIVYDMQSAVHQFDPFKHLTNSMNGASAAQSSLDAGELQHYSHELPYENLHANSSS